MDNLFSTKMYHGSDLKLKVLKPTAYNAGHRFKKHSWSVFMWPTYDLAYKWAIFVAIRNIIRVYEKKDPSIHCPRGIHKSTGFNSYDFELFMVEENYDFICEKCIGAKAYVYTVDCPIDTNFGFGNNNAQPEYTYDGELKIANRDEITITRRIINKLFDMVSYDEYHKRSMEFGKENIRGLLGLIFYPIEEPMHRWKYVYRRIDLKEVKPGDDLDEVMSKYGDEEETDRVKTAHRHFRTQSLKEGYEPTMEEFSKAVYTKTYKSFDEFCNVFHTFDDLVIWFHANRIKWPKYDTYSREDALNYTGPVTWPDEFIKTKTGVCFDHALFAYMFCKRNNIPAKIYRFSRFYNLAKMKMETTLYCSSHFVTLVKRKFGYWMFSYSGTGSDTAGPFDTEKDFIKWFSKRFAETFEMMTGVNDKIKYHMNVLPESITNNKFPTDFPDYNNRYIIRYGAFTDKDMDFILSNIGNTRITINEFVEKSDGCHFDEDKKVIKHSLLDVIRNNFRAMVGKSANKIYRFFTDNRKSVKEDYEPATETFIPYKAEVKLCYHTGYGPVKKGLPNLIVHKDGKRWRVRSEVLIFKDDKLLLCKDTQINQYGTLYKLPGGGIDDPKESIESAAKRECEEEVRIVPKNIQYKTDYTVLYKKIPEWHKKILHPDGIYYDGAITFVCVAEYDKKYNGYVKKMDRDDTQNNNSRFYSYDEVKDLLTPIHRKLFEDYLKNITSDGLTNESSIITMEGVDDNVNSTNKKDVYIDLNYCVYGDEITDEDLRDLRRSVTSKVARMCDKTGYKITLPENYDNWCNGRIYINKNFNEIFGEGLVDKLVERLSEKFSDYRIYNYIEPHAQAEDVLYNPNTDKFYAMVINVRKDISSISNMASEIYRLKLMVQEAEKILPDHIAMVIRDDRGISPERGINLDFNFITSPDKKNLSGNVKQTYIALSYLAKKYKSVGESFIYEGGSHFVTESSVSSNDEPFICTEDSGLNKNRGASVQMAQREVSKLIKKASPELQGSIYINNSFKEIVDRYLSGETNLVPLIHYDYNLALHDSRGSDFDRARKLDDEVYAIYKSLNNKFNSKGMYFDLQGEMDEGIIFLTDDKSAIEESVQVSTNRFVTEGVGSGTYDFPLNALNVKKFVGKLPALKNAKVAKGYRGLIHARLEQPVAHPVAFVNIELKSGNIQASHGDPGWIGKAKAKILQHTPHKATKESYDHFVTEGEIGMMKNPYNKFGNKKVTRRVDHKQAVKHPSMIKKYVNSHESYTDFF